MPDPTSTTCTDEHTTATATAQNVLLQATTGISSSSSQTDKLGRCIHRNSSSSSLGRVEITSKEAAAMTPNINRNNSREVTPAVEQQNRQQHQYHQRQQYPQARQQLEEVHLPLKKRRVDDEQEDGILCMPPPPPQLSPPPPPPPPLAPPQQRQQQHHHRRHHQEHATATSSYRSINNNTHHIRRSSSMSSMSSNDNNRVGRSAGVPRSSAASDKPQFAAVRPVSVFHLVRQRRKRRQQSPRPLCVGSNPNFPLPSNGIVEIAGAAGAGKSQLAMSLCADCVSSNAKAKAVYVFLGGSGRSHKHTMAQRLNVMLRTRWDVLMKRQEEERRQQRNQQLQQLMMSPSNPATPSSTNSSISNNITDELDQDEVIRDCLNRVYLRWIRNSDELMELLESGLPQFLRQHPNTKVVVLDGIANLFRINEDLAFASSSMPMNPWHNRAVTFFQISRMCRKTSSDFHVPFVVTNEATSKIRPVQISSTASSSFRINNSFNDNTSELEPALGLAWFQCVDSRFFVKRGHRRSVPNPIIRQVQTRNEHRGNNNNNNNSHEDNGEIQAATSTTNTDEVLVRTVRCIKAPHISTSAFGAFEFWIDQRGAVPLRSIV